MRDYLLRSVELLYAIAPPEVKRKFAEAYARRHEMSESELRELFKELYREVYANKLLAASNGSRRYERVDDVEEIVDEGVEAVEGGVEEVGDVEEAVDDDEYVGQRILRRAWRWTI